VEARNGIDFIKRNLGSFPEPGEVRGGVEQWISTQLSGWNQSWAHTSRASGRWWHFLQYGCMRKTPCLHPDCPLELPATRDALELSQPSGWVQATADEPPLPTPLRGSFGAQPQRWDVGGSLSIRQQLTRRYPVTRVSGRTAQAWMDTPKFQIPSKGHRPQQRDLLLRGREGGRTDEHRRTNLDR
jgi:hypothetical protein